jgi:hypothetical protein
LAIEALKHASVYGRRSQNHIAQVVLSVIFGGAHEKVFPKEAHRRVGKETGETCHMQRWNCTDLHWEM